MSVNPLKLLCPATSQEQFSEYEKYLVGISFDIIASTSNYEDNKTVGNLNGKFYNIEQAIEDNKLTDVVSSVFDDIDQYTFDIYELVTKLQDELLYDKPIWKDVNKKTSDEFMCCDCHQLFFIFIAVVPPLTDFITNIQALF